MKNSLIALSVFAAASVAFADSNVTLYGKIDMGPGIEKTKGSPAAVSLDSGNLHKSRWGICGTEDLGGGNAVGFQLEQGFHADRGEANDSRAFHRVARLFVKGNWGEVGFGRWGALSSGTGPYELISGSTWMAEGITSFGATNAWDTIAGNPQRMDNSIIYVSPNMAGFQFSLMYSNGEDGVDKIGYLNDEKWAPGDDSAHKWSENPHYYGIGGIYNSGPLKADLVFEVRDRKGLGTSQILPHTPAGTRNISFFNTVDKPIYNINFGISYDFGWIVPEFGYAFAKQTDVAHQHTFGLSAASPVAGGKLVYGVRYLFGGYEGNLKDAYKDEVKTDYSLLTINLYYDYPLSKRTELYAYAGWSKGYKFYTHPGLVTNLFNNSDINANGYAIQLGMVHSF